MLVGCWKEERRQRLEEEKEGRGREGVGEEGE